MPRGPKGEKRPADVIGAAIMVAKIATGERTESQPARESGNNPMSELGRAGGLKGGKARAKKLSAERRLEIAQKAAETRWRKNDS
jgi:hypothetical protein